jgi:hypothetical protein
MCHNEDLHRNLMLRNNAERVQIIVPNGAAKPVLGTSSPEEEQRRVNIVAHWAGAQTGLRKPALVGIEQPLEQRTQTILYYQLPANERGQINGTVAMHSQSRKNQHEPYSVNLVTPDNSNQPE